MQLLPEWTSQRAILLTWPHANTDWAPDLSGITQDYTALVRAIIYFEPVVILAYDDDHAAMITQHLKRERIFDPTLITVISIPTNDVWIRDYGPLTAKDSQGQLTYLNFQFNAWGGKYNAVKDNAVCSALIQHGIIDSQHYQTHEFVLEGGSIDLNDELLLLTTDACLLSPTRNPGLTQTEIEQILCERLGIKAVLWLHSGSLIGDDTDSHVDMLARYIPGGLLCYTACVNKDDRNYPALQSLTEEIAQLPLPGEKIPLFMPKPIYNPQGQQLPASYANFLWVNGGLLVPQYNDLQADTAAIGQLNEIVSNRKIVGVPCLHLVSQFGSLHCATMQLPS
jgi:agmatine/peptidylarginine deiminase